jgi:hypothetical protein
MWDKTKLDAFLSISYCYNTIRLHPNTQYFDNVELKYFKEKLTKLRNFIDEFIDNLPNEIPV